jgi:hypothetical protein
MGRLRRHRTHHGLGHPRPGAVTQHLTFAVAHFRTHMSGHPTTRAPQCEGPFRAPGNHAANPTVRQSRGSAERQSARRSAPCCVTSRIDRCVCCA